MVTVHFISEQIDIQVEEETLISDAARKAGIYLSTPCGGKGTCGKCKVMLDNGTEVLACRTKVISDINVYTRNEQEMDESLDILSNGKVRNVELKPNYSKIYKNGVTTVFCNGVSVGTEDGDTSQTLYGVTIDIGTTTLVAALINLKTGDELASVSKMNPQCVYAQDVVSRINYTMEKSDGLETLYKCENEAFCSMIKELSEDKSIDLSQIYEIVFSGNTTMLHLATQTDPYSLGQYPYEPAIWGNCYYPASQFEMPISQYGQVYLPPIISAYVGADITSGILSSELVKQNGTTLFIDIGTNGEMVMACDGSLTATSTAAGPAFEGMNISFGMRAEKGAIEEFSIMDDGSVQIKTILNEEAVGICGSGLFDIVAELSRVGIIESNGRFVKPQKCNLPDNLKNRLVKYEGKSAFQLTDKVYLTQMDVRQIQLAKSAVRAGIEAMIGLNNKELNEIDRIFIAGSFGYHLSASSLTQVGIIPKALKDRISFLGNTSKTGGSAFLLNAEYRCKMQQYVKKVKILELSEYPGFENLFMQHMGF